MSETFAPKIPDYEISIKRNNNNGRSTNSCLSGIAASAAAAPGDVLPPGSPVSRKSPARASPLMSRSSPLLFGPPYSPSPPSSSSSPPLVLHSVPVSPGQQQQNYIYLPGGSNSTLLCLPEVPPEPSEQQRVMQAAAASERQRAKALELQEADLTADELRAVLRRERHRMGKMAADLAALKANAVQSQLEAEMIEEGRINNLMRRVEILQQEKGRIIVELEREEEMLTNTLQKRLNEVLLEKSQLEARIRKEERAFKTLQTQFGGITSLEEEDEMEEED